MGLLELASGNSVWRGYDYYKEGRVISSDKTDCNHYTGKVKGSEDAVYEITLDLDHPKRSVCNCLHAEGTRRICKHKVALYFSIFPGEAERILREAEEWKKAKEEREKERYNEIKEYVYSLSKQELRDELIYRMMNGSDNSWY